MRVVVTFNSKALDAAIAGLDAVASGAFRTQLSEAVNFVGQAIHHGLVDPLKHQTGLTGSTIPRALHDMPAGAGGLAYQIATRGGDISLKYFGAREAGGGVTAHPRGVQTQFDGAFIRSGRAGNRRASPKLNGQVYRNVDDGRWGGHIQKVKSGVFIPQEMVRGAALNVFNTVVASQLEPRVAAVMTMIAGGKG
jgi:hypothetical protein